MLFRSTELRRFAGLQLARNGGPGQSGGYFLRGVAAGGVVVLLDGVRIGSASLGQTPSPRGVEIAAIVSNSLVIMFYWSLY